jgi:4,5-dihydroxyphthalate decarboxylase
MSHIGGGLAVERQAPSAASPVIPISIAMADYDRTRRLIDGRVRPDGIELKTSGLYIGDFCMKPVYESYDVAEMSFSWYVMARCRGEPVVALPIFPLRMSVFAYVLVRADSSYNEPKDLIGKRIGVTAFRMTVNMWLRGIFREHYGLEPERVTWIKTWNDEGAGYVIPSSIRYTVADNRTPEQLLDRGEVDAIYVPELPQSFVEGRSSFRRLFRDAQGEMRNFVRSTGILPITHVIVMKRSLGEQKPWVAESLFRAFCEAQRQSDEYWFADEKHLAMSDAIFFLEQQRAAYGVNSWSHGFAKNRKVIETFLRYSHEQGYTRRRMSAEELFLENTLRL